jgi:hypothetical protein
VTGQDVTSVLVTGQSVTSVLVTRQSVTSVLVTRQSGHCAHRRGGREQVSGGEGRDDE